MFSQCGKYRYFLQRKWSNVGSGILLFLMLNPSVASESGSDPTALACQNRARALGYGGFAICNLFARVESDSSKVYKMWKTDPMELIGPDNDRVIAEKIRAHGKVLCAWGDDGLDYRKRVDEIMGMMAREKIVTLCIRETELGQPMHPRGLQIQCVPIDQQPRKWPN